VAATGQMNLLLVPEDLGRVWLCKPVATEDARPNQES